MKLSIVIICWNDLNVIRDCLASIYERTRTTSFEVVVSDNGSTDGSLVWIRENYPQTRIIENNANLGFARGNNAGIATANGEYTLILNPDTIIHDGALDTLIAFADAHPTYGAFGNRVLNPDGSYQNPARPFPTLRRYFIAAFNLRFLGRVSEAFIADRYIGWNGTTIREIDWQIGCCLLVRTTLLKQLGGFDERFFYHFEEVDLCRRIWASGTRILYTPDAVITHLGGQSVGRFKIRFELEKYRNRYRYFHKHFGLRGAARVRWVVLAWLWMRRLGYGMKYLVRRDDLLAGRLELYRVALRWNSQLDPARFLADGSEPDVGYAPIAPPPKIAP